jgi:uncharacterized membrane protein YdcZ (DUF606 family)
MSAREIAVHAAATQPVLWSALGYRFEAASMIAGLSACLMVRVWVSLSERTSRPAAWAIDSTVTGIALLFTAGWIVLQRPEPFYALLSGTGFGALGAGIIALALAWVRRVQPLVDAAELKGPQS